MENVYSIDGCVTKSKAAKLLGLHTRAFEKWVDENDIPFYWYMTNYGYRKRVYKFDEIKNYVKDNSIDAYKDMRINFNDYLKIREASELLGVTEGTLRNWQKDGKIKVYQSSLNSHRLYKKEDLEEILDNIHPV